MNTNSVVHPKKRGRPRKTGGAVKASSTNVVSAVYNALPSSAQNGLNNAINTVFGISQPSSDRSNIINNDPEYVRHQKDPVIKVDPAAVEQYKEWKDTLAYMKDHPDPPTPAKKGYYIPPTYGKKELANIQLANSPGFLSSHPKFIQNHPFIASAIHGSGLKHKKCKGGALFPAGYDGESSKKKGRGVRKCVGKCKGKKGDGFIGSILGGVIGDLLPF